MTDNRIRVRDYDFDGAGAETHSFFQTVEAAVDAGAEELTIDLGGIEYIDSTTLGCVFDAHKRQAEAGRALVLTGVSPRLMRLLRQVHVLDELIVKNEPLPNADLTKEATEETVAEESDA